MRRRVFHNGGKLVHHAKTVPGPLARALEWSVVMIGLVWVLTYAWARWIFRPRRLRAS
jgi:hypothetical protein